jgi:hypothetical protein
MMIFIIGDSNLRNVVEGNQQTIKDKVGEDIVFEQAGNNESLKASLEKANIANYSKVVIGTVLNEITHKAKAVKSRDDIINAVTHEQASIVGTFASGNPNVTFVILPPFLRLEPAWVQDKLRMISLFLKDHLEKLNLRNVDFRPPVDILEEDLSASDKVHLNEAGKGKLLASLIGQPTPGSVSGINRTPTQSTNWAATPTPRTQRSTRRTAARSKRGREASSSDEDNSSGSKRKRPNDFGAILAKLNAMTDELRDERAKAAEKTDILVAKINSTTETTATHSKKIEEIVKVQDVCNITVASLREDLDVIENDAMKSIILVRKLKSKDNMPSNKAEINEHLKKVANDLVSKLGGKPEMIKFVTMAYNELDKTKQSNRAGSTPAFKIGFKQTQDAVCFKEAGTKAAKIEGGDLHKVVFAYQHCSATRIRTQIMWLIVNKLKAQGKDAWVNVNNSKPKLQVKTDKKFPMDYTFVKAIESYKNLLADEDLKDINAQAKRFFKGQCKQIFIVLSD